MSTHDQYQSVPYSLISNSYPTNMPDPELINPGGQSGSGNQIPIRTIDIGNGLIGVVSTDPDTGATSLFEVRTDPTLNLRTGPSNGTPFDYARLNQDNAQFLASLGIQQGQLDLSTEIAARNYGLDLAQFGYQQTQDAFSNKLRQEAFDYQKESDLREQQYRDNQLAQNQAQWEAEMAFKIGDQQLAAQKQADYVRLQERGMQLQASAQAASAAAQQASAAAAMASAQAQAKGHELQYKAATEANAIDRQQVANQLAIANMDDATRRMLGLQSNQTGQFSAETPRMGTAGQLKLENDKFLLDAATQAKNLPALFFMQRGVAPDWDAIMAGGAPPVVNPDGTPMTPEQRMEQLRELLPLQGGPIGTQAYTPETAAPDFSAGAGAPPPPSDATGAGAPPPEPAAGQQRPPWKFGGGAGGPDPRTFRMHMPRRGGDDWTQRQPSRLDMSQMADMSKMAAMFGGIPKMAYGGVATGPTIVGDDPTGNDSSKEELVTPTMTPSGQPAAVVQPMNQSQYTGPSGTWVPTSSNDYANAQGSPMPHILQTLASYGYPVGPQLYANMTGTIAPKLNVASAVAERGGGILPSFQQLKRNTQEERDEYGGIIQGISGTPWETVQDAIQRGTANLRRAVRAQ